MNARLLTAALVAAWPALVMAQRPVEYFGEDDSGGKGLVAALITFFVVLWACASKSGPFHDLVESHPGWGIPLCVGIPVIVGLLLG